MVAYGKEKGMTEIEGPFGFTDMDKECWVIEGFDQRQNISTLYNPNIISTSSSVPVMKFLVSGLNIKYLLLSLSLKKWLVSMNLSCRSIISVC